MIWFVIGVGVLFLFSVGGNGLDMLDDDGYKQAGGGKRLLMWLWLMLKSLGLAVLGVLALMFVFGLLDAIGIGGGTRYR